MYKWVQMLFAWKLWKSLYINDIPYASIFWCNDVLWTKYLQEHIWFGYRCHFWIVARSSLKSTLIAIRRSMRHSHDLYFIAGLGLSKCGNQDWSRQLKSDPIFPFLTHWGRDKMAAIYQTTFWNAFSWMKIYKFWLRFHWSLFLRVQSTIFQHCFRWWLGAVQATSHYLNQWWLVYWRIYASLGVNELNRRLVPQRILLVLC